MKVFFEKLTIYRFQMAESGRHTNLRDHVSLCISGLDELSIEGQPAMLTAMPCLILLPAGSRASYAYNSRRENWAAVISAHWLNLRWDSEPGMVAMTIGGERRIVPHQTPINPDRVGWWRQRFATLRQESASPLASERLRAGLRLCGILGELGSEFSTAPLSAPAQLKSLLDDGALAGRTLRDLSAGCGYTADHLRRLFQKEYGLSPREYETHRRMAGAMEALAVTPSSVKEIAFAYGFASLPSFSHAFTQHFGMSPREARRRARSSS